MVAAYRKRMWKLELQVEWLAKELAREAISPTLYHANHTAEELMLLAQGYAEGVIERERVTWQPDIKEGDGGDA